jgi:hypothetical protein
MMTTLAGVATLAVATPWLAQDFLLLTVNPSSLVIGTVIGGVGALAVEATPRVAVAHRAPAA